MNEKPRQVLLAVLCNLDIVPDFSRTGHQTQLSRVACTFFAFLGYCLLSLIPLYGYVSGDGLRTVNSLLIDQSKAAAVIRNISGMSMVMFEQIVKKIGRIQLPKNARYRTRFQRGFKVLLLFFVCLVLLPSRLKNPRAMGLLCTLPGSPEKAALLAGLSSFLAGLTYLGLEGFTESYTDPETTRNLFFTVDLLNQIIRGYSTIWTDPYRIVLGLSLVGALYYLDYLLSPRILLSAPGNSHVTTVSVVQMISNAEMNYRYVHTFLRLHLLQTALPAVLNTLIIIARIVGNDAPWVSWVKANFVVPDWWLQSIFLAADSPMRIGNIHRIDRVVAERLMIKLVYHLVKIPLMIALGCVFSPELYNSRVIVQRGAEAGYLVNNHSRWHSAMAGVDTMLYEGMGHALWLIPLHLVTESYRIFGMVQLSHLLLFMTRVNQLVGTLHLC